MFKVFINSVPFGENDKKVFSYLKKNNCEIYLSENVHDVKKIKDCDAIIAGTKKFSMNAINKLKKLKIISRVGIGLDGLNLKELKKKNIAVTYTPDAPSDAVATLTLAKIIICSRMAHLSNLNIRKKKWVRYYCKDITNLKIGIIGFGRIGKLVTKKLQDIGCKNINVFEVDQKKVNFLKKKNLWMSLSKILTKSDLISLHIPLNKKNINFISTKKMKLMKSSSILINTSRGPIIDEDALYTNLKKGKFSAIALDVFNNEPYFGKLKRFDRCFLTAHLGSMTTEARNRMELEAAKSVVDYLNFKKLYNPVPKSEINAQ